MSFKGRLSSTTLRPVKEAQPLTNEAGRISLFLFLFPSSSASSSQRLTVQIGAVMSLKASDNALFPDAFLVLKTVDASGATCEETKTKVFHRGPKPSQLDLEIPFDLTKIPSVNSWRLLIDAFACDASGSSFEPQGTLSFNQTELSEKSSAGITWYSFGLKADASLVVPKSSSSLRLPDSSSSDNQPLNLGRSGSVEGRPTSLMLWLDEMDPSVAKTIPKDEIQRQAAIFEFISTEKAYMDDLDHALKVYSFEIMKACLTQSEYFEIVGQFETLRDLSKRFLKALQERPRQVSGCIERIGDLMRKYIPQLEPAYSAYFESKEDVMHMIQRKQKDDVEFSALLERGKLNSGNMDIHSFRLKPLQRITRYSLLLREISKHTADSHVDKADIVEALDATTNLLSRLNDRMKASQLLQEFDNFTSKMIIPPSLAPFVLDGSKVKMVKTGVFSRIKMSKIRRTFTVAELRPFGQRAIGDARRRLSIFQDPAEGHFLIVTQLSPEGELLMTQRVPVDTVEFVNHAELGIIDPTDFGIEFSTPWDEKSRHHRLLFRAHSASEKNEWVIELQALRKSQLEKKLTPSGVNEILEAAARLKEKPSLTEVEKNLLNAGAIIEALMEQNKTASRVKASERTSLPSPHNIIVLSFQTYCKCRKMREIAEKAEKLSLIRVQENLETLQDSEGPQPGPKIVREWEEMRLGEDNPFSSLEDMWRMCGPSSAHGDPLLLTPSMAATESESDSDATGNA